MIAYYIYYLIILGAIKNPHTPWCPRGAGGLYSNQISFLPTGPRPAGGELFLDAKYPFDGLSPDLPADTFCLARKAAPVATAVLPRCAPVFLFKKKEKEKKRKI